jgi:alpha-D-ribose 1-methylphosphonate 5-triphosphate synthase subunit PhnI
MGYVAVKGGEEAIRAARKFARYLRLKGAGGPEGSSPIQVSQIRDQMRLAVDRVMSEGSLYALSYAALALKQSEGDTFEAAFIMRAFRSSATFKDVPGGQVLGPTRDYAIQLLDFSLMEENEEAIEQFKSEYLKNSVTNTTEVPSFPQVLDLLREEGLLDPAPPISGDRPFDITVESLRFPAPRSAKLQALARSETGGMMALAYSTMRGFGSVHPAIGELRVGFVPLWVRHPSVDDPLFAGEVMVTEAQVISEKLSNNGKDKKPVFTVGYGLCFGHNEVKAISMAILDRSTSAENPIAPAEEEEFVLLHTDGIEAAGFTAHWKLPHYVTFQSQLDRLRAARKEDPNADGNK